MRKLLFIRIAASVFIFFSCGKHEVRHTIQYFISSKSNMNISYIDANGELLYMDNVSSIWKYAFNAPEDGRVIKLSVNSIDGNAVRGSIFIDGQEAAISNSSTGSVTVSTRLP